MRRYALQVPGLKQLSVNVCSLGLNCIIYLLIYILVSSNMFTYCGSLVNYIAVAIPVFLGVLSFTSSEVATVFIPF